MKISWKFWGFVLFSCWQLWFPEKIVKFCQNWIFGQNFDFSNSVSDYYPKIPNQRGIIFSPGPATRQGFRVSISSICGEGFFLVDGGWPVFYWLMRFFSAHDSRVVIAIFFAKCPFLICNIKAYQGVGKTRDACLHSCPVDFQLQSFRVAKYGKKLSSERWNHHYDICFQTW